jgi:hypothetical protein
MATVIVDAENVRRSLWPNLTRSELVHRTRDWAGRQGHRVLIIFDGGPPEDASDLIGTRYADDEIVRLARETNGEVWVVTSDRALRDRLTGDAQRVIGGGTFAREI